MKTTLEILKDARELIAKPNGWTQGTFARDKDGRADADPTDPKVSCFCAWGALIRAGTSGPYVRAYKAMEEAASGNIPSFNDTPGRTQAEVVAKFDEAIAAEEAKVAA